MIFECPCGSCPDLFVLDPEHARRIQAAIDGTPPVTVEQDGIRVIVPPAMVVRHGGIPQ